MQEENLYTQDQQGLIPYFLAYLFFTLLPLILLMLIFLRFGLLKWSSLVLLLFIIYFAIWFPVNFFIYIKPFFNKINLKDKIKLKNDGLAISRNLKEIFIPFSSVESLSFLNYFIDLKMFSFSLGNFTRYLGVFKLIAKGEELYLPPTYLQRDRLIQKIIEAAKLKKEAPTTETNLTQGFFVWQRDAGFYYQWKKTGGNVSVSDLKVEVLTPSEKLIGYLAVLVFFIIIFLLLVVGTGFLGIF